MSEVELKPILVALVINLTLIFALPRLFTNPTGFKAFDDFVSYLKAQQAFLGFNAVLFAIVMYAASYYMNNYSDDSESHGHHGRREELMSDDFMKPATPKLKSIDTD
jgi:hypothetical protein